MPQGQVYSINSHDVYMYSAGEGKSTIVFISGSGTPSAYTDFYNLQYELQPYARTISYDRAGFGWSEKSNGSRIIDTVVDEMQELLQKSGEQAPYILAGHSLASLEAIRHSRML